MITGLFTNVFGVCDAKNYNKLLIVVNKQFEKTEKNIGIGISMKKTY
jgi:hypothetical protein